MTKNPTVEITDIVYRVTLPNELSYRVKRYYVGGKYERWEVIGGSYYNPRHCDPNGKTYKKIMAIVQASIAPEVDRDKAKNLALALNPF